MTMNFERRVRIRAQFRKVEKHLAEMEQKVLALMRHPEATPEQIETLREMYVPAYRQVADMRSKLYAMGCPL